MNIGFIGLGNMGAPMAHNLLKAGHALRVFDLATGAVAALVQAGATGAETACGVLQDADVVITMLPASAQVKAVYLGDDGLLAKVAPGVLLIDLLDHRPAGRPGSRQGGRRPRQPDARCTCIWRHRRCGGGYPDLHGRRRRGGLCQGAAGSRGHGPQHRALRRQR